MQHERIGLGTQQNFLTGYLGGTSHSGKLRAMASFWGMGGWGPWLGEARS